MNSNSEQPPQQFPTTLNRQNVHGGTAGGNAIVSFTLPRSKGPRDFNAPDADINRHSPNRRDMLSTTNRQASNNLPLMPRPLSVAVSPLPHSNPELPFLKSRSTSSFPTFPPPQSESMKMINGSLSFDLQPFISVTMPSRPSKTPTAPGNQGKHVNTVQRFNILPYDYQYPIFKDIVTPSLAAALKMGSADGHPSKITSDHVTSSYDADTIAPATGIVDIIERTIENIDDFEPDLSPSVNGQPVDMQIPTFYQPPASVLAKKQRSKQTLSSKELQILLLHICRIGDFYSLVSLVRSPRLDVNSVDDEGRTPLMFASAAGHGECVDLLLKKGSFVHQADYSGRTALHWASVYGKLNVVAALLKAGADPCVDDYSGKTAMHCSSASPNDSVLKLLMKHVSNHKGRSDLNILNAVDDDQMTCLMWACFHGNFRQVKRLLKQSAKIVDPSIIDVEGKNALHWTAENKNVQCASLILARYPHLLRTTDKYGRTTLHLSCSEGNISLAYYLLTTDASIVGDVDQMKRSAVHWTCLCGRPSILRMLCEFGADLDLRDEYSVSPMFYAAQQNYLDCINILLRYGASVSIADQNLRTSLIWASIRGHLDLVKLLCDAKSEVNARDKNQFTALHFAAHGGFTSCCVILVRNGAIIDSEDENRQTPLFHAAMSGHTETLIALIEEGAQIDCQDVNGRRPLAVASSLGHVDVVNILLTNGALVNSIDAKKSTALHEASFSGKSDVLVVLLSNGADPNVIDENGVTPLHWAAVNGHLGCCRLLLAKGAQVNATVNDVDHDTPLDYAYLNDNGECAKYLIDCGAMMGNDLM